MLNANVKIKLLRDFDFLKCMKYQTDGSAGFDVMAAIDTDTDIMPGEVRAVPAGFAMEMEPGYEAQVRSRSGLAFRDHIIVFTPATIDSDYRGELCIVIKNMSDKKFTITPGMRIAQIVVSQYAKASFEYVEELSPTDRGHGGFGSTGR